ncbi:MAG TPA: hypothetical protein VGF93_11225 [Solirubrobacteraceae bacterium]|jgi:hypothetical protein
MKTAHAITWPSAPAEPSAALVWRTRLSAHLRAPALDRELATGIAPWRSREHAARALQLTRARSRRGLARSLERLVEQAEEPPTAFRGAVITPSREQVMEARPVLLGIAGRLRSGDPIDARGIARLRRLLSDGNGPCYVKIRGNALTSALQEISQWLAVPQ